MIKTGLVVEGGGMKCAYSAGILDRFLDDGIEYDYCVGVSAGAANMASFVAGQRKRNYRFYTMHAKDKEYLSIHNYLKNGQLFGLQYIYGTLSNSDGADPLDYRKLFENPCEYEIVATNAKTGRPEYFPKQTIHRDDYLQLMASSAIPVLCRPVQIGKNEYFDGGVSDSIPVERALARGCDKIVVILSNPRDYVKTPERHRKIYKRKLAAYPEIIKGLDLRHRVYEAEKQKALELEKEGKAFVFAPSEQIRLNTYGKNMEIERALYALGLRDYDAKKEQLEAFLQTDLQKHQKKIPGSGASAEYLVRGARPLC